ncbi:MAG TPA: N-acetylglucosamine-6-phosphate deacetylase [Symbiobacteriaceae bacterium]|jgi:N-acetylglucosamine-6-phosphate deacetylase
MRLAGVIYGAERPPFEGALVVEAGRITALEAGVRQGADLVDLRPARLVPGFIDLHIHGGGGWEAAAPTPGDAAAFGRFLAAQGTTAYYASLSAVPVAMLEGQIATLARAAAAQAAGLPEGAARLLGIHLEGPFLNPAKKGAMPAEWFRTPDVPLIERWLDLGEGHIRQVTVAPELHGAPYLIRALAGLGITVTGGHTDATAEQTHAGIDAGVTVATHIYNAMRGLEHRSPGPLGAYLTDPRVTCELICDCIHVHPLAMKLALAAKGLDRVTVISDAGPFSGLPAGEYAAMGRQQIRVDETGHCRLPDGTIAGSSFHQVVGVRNLVERLGLSLEDAVRLAATNPARVAGVGDRKGRLSPGFDADVVALDDQFRVQLTLVEGKVAYRAGEAGSRLNPVRRPVSVG